MSRALVLLRNALKDARRTRTETIIALIGYLAIFIPRRARYAEVTRGITTANVYDAGSPMSSFDTMRRFFSHQRRRTDEMPIEDGLIGDPPNPYGPIAFHNGIAVYAKPGVPPGCVELRDRYGVCIGVIYNVGSISIHGDKKE